MLVRAQVIHDTAALLAINHVGVKTARVLRCKISYPRHRLPAKGVNVRIVPDRKGDRCSVLGKHNSSPAPHIQEWKRKRFSAPKLVHNAGPDRGAMVLAAESEALLNTRMQKFEFF